MEQQTAEQASAVNPALLIQLAPDMIVEDEVTNVRRGPKLETEDAEIKRLAKDIETNGQIQPVLVRKVEANGESKYHIVAGRRRLAAARLGGFDLTAMVETRNDDSAYRAALAENLKRRNFSPVDLALNIKDIRAKYNWEGQKGSLQVAKFLNVSPATVTEHEKLLTELPADLLPKVHSGEMSFAAAQALWSEVEKSKAAEVAKEAERLAAKERTDKAYESSRKGFKKGQRLVGGSKTSSTPTSDEPTPQSASKTTKPVAPAKVQKRHVRAAAEAKGALTEKKPRNAKSLLEPFVEVIESADGYSEVLVAFAKYFVNTYAPGGGSVSGVRTKLNEIDYAVQDCQEKLAKAKAKAKGKAA